MKMEMNRHRSSKELSAPKADRYQEHVYENNHPLVQFFVKARVNEILKQISPGYKVLDAGCGEGFVTRKIAQITHKKVVAIDILENNINFAKGFNDGIEYKCTCIGDYATTEKFDVIVLSEVVEHVTNYEDIIDKVASLLEDGGKIVVTIPANEFVLKVAWFFAPFFGARRYVKYRETRNHYYIPTLKEIEKVARKNNLRIVEYKRLPFSLLSSNIFLVLKSIS